MLEAVPPPADDGVSAALINQRYQDGSGEEVLRALHLTGLRQRLDKIVDELGVASLFNLVAALRASQLEGVGGTLTIHVPRKQRDRIEVDWTSTGRP